MTVSGEIELKREVEAIQIPSGQTIVLPVGTSVMITQSLGGTYTVATQAGLARISEKDKDALGIEEENAHSAVAESGEEGDLESQVWAQLKKVYDPEIPVNIVDLGLVYDCHLKENEGKMEVGVKMTLTAPGCGMGPTIANDAKTKILMLDGVDEAEVELVWDPPWNQDMISEEGKMRLGMV